MTFTEYRNICSAGNLNVEEAPTTCDITRGNVDVRNMMDDHVKKVGCSWITNSLVSQIYPFLDRVLERSGDDKTFNNKCV